MGPTLDNPFARIRFRGEFRSYQAAVLASSQRHLDDGRIHIVAPPGSGKTVLGLELIRRLEASALVLSPTVVIAQQWRQRFEERFLPSGEAASSYVSERLDRPAALTSVTYQALHARLADGQDQGSDSADGEAGGRPEDRCAALAASLLSAGVRTLCLDEAHHLRREWQRALEMLLAATAGKVRIIALTATPPFDATRPEWERYIAVCGPIDEEILIPELVNQRSLCPHQDYVYLNYTSPAEKQAITDHRRRVELCLGRLSSEAIVGRALELGGFKAGARHLPETVFADADAWSALAALAAHTGQPIDRKLVRLLSGGWRTPRFTAETAAAAVQWLVKREDLFGELSTRTLQIARAHQLVHRSRLQIATDERLDADLRASTGKLVSVGRIAEVESDALGDQLRLVVLTDFIRRDHLPVVGADQPLTAVGAVPVFEALRRCLPADVPIGLLSGSIVIWPNSAIGGLVALARQRGVTVVAKPLPGVDHSLVTTSGTNRDKVPLVTAAFERGDVRVLVGTAALLGEGWDSPCLNTLVLASFVASYVLSNQMRGRAIRIDPGQPDKTANIWHLATVEPPQAGLDTVGPAAGALDQPAGHDFAAVARRFDGFFGPAYDQPYITSGIRRLSIIQPPFDQDGVAQINRQMERRAADRTDLAARWRGAADQTRRPEVAEVVAAPSLPLAFVFHDLLALLVVAFVLIDLPLMFGQTGLKALAKAGREGASGGVLALGLIVAICGLLIWIGVKFGRRIAAYFSPRRSAAALARALLTTLVQTGQIASDQATVTIAAAAAGHRVEFALLGASTRDKAVFAAAAADMLRPIKQPRYLAIRRRPWGGHQASASFAAPAAVSTAAAAAIFQRELARRLGRFDLVYTQNVAGRRLLLKCRRRSYINRNARIVEHIQRVAYTI